MAFKVARTLQVHGMDEGVHVQVTMDGPSAIVLGNFLTLMAPHANVAESWKIALGELGDRIHAQGNNVLKDRLG